MFRFPKFSTNLFRRDEDKTQPKPTWIDCELFDLFFNRLETDDSLTHIQKGSRGGFM